MKEIGEKISWCTYKNKLLPLLPEIRRHPGILVVQVNWININVDPCELMLSCLQMMEGME